MNWGQDDINKLKGKGLTLSGDTGKNKTVVSRKISLEKNYIEALLWSLKREGTIKNYVREHQFHSVRRFRFDWAITDLKIAIEYEGIISKKSGHTTINGFTSDCTKYNLAAVSGWKVLRYTAKNYKNLGDDLKNLLKNLSIV